MTKLEEEEKIPQKERSWLTRFIAVLAGEPQTREQLKDVLRDAEERNLLSAEVLGMIERILQVSEIQVREIMVPKAQMVALNINNTLETILPQVIKSGHSRFPVYDKSGKEIIGMLLAKDLLKFFNRDPKQFNFVDIMRPIVFTPQSKRLDILLREFRVNRNHLAIVLDEYSHVAGLVTIEDVLEQIVGEIEDEYDIDDEISSIKPHEDGSFIVKATTPIEEFNRYFNTDFSDDEFDTIGGILLQNFGHLPKRGEKIKIANYRFKILHSDNRRIYLIEVKEAKTKPKSKKK